MGSLGEQDRNGRYVEEGASGQGLMLLVGEPGRQEPQALERPRQGGAPTWSLGVARPTQR
jgi:hypothetical protein